MPVETVYSADWATVRYEPEGKYVFHTFHKPIHGQHLRDTLNAGLVALIAHGAHKWLSDDRNNAALEPEDFEFSLTDWGPRAAQGGWKYWALVVPESLFGRADMSEVVTAYYNLGVTVRVFVDLEEARDWLISQ